MRSRIKSIIFIRNLLLGIILLSGMFPGTTFAVYDPYMQTNNILFYSRGGSGACPPGGLSSAGSSLSIPDLTGSDNAEKIWNFLVSEGLSEEQAAGLMGNIYQEAQFIPDAEEGNGIGYGIVQWSFERRTALEEKARELNVAVSDLGFQLSFMLDEMKNPPLVNFNGLFEKYNASADGNVLDLLKEQKTIEDSTIVFHDSFERSNDYNTHGGIQHRIDYANEVFKKFTGRSATGKGSSGTAGDCTSSAASGDLTQLVVEYAWPTFSMNNFDGPVPGPKPAYLEAATRRTKEGKFVGGGMEEIGIPGIDCGGFVTTLLQESNYEPEYNDKQEAVGGQRMWAEANWDYIGDGGMFDAALLRPGDVAYKKDGQHTFLYIGPVDGFDSQFASASYDWWRAPMSGSAEENAANRDYVWYGKR